jgi:hypothetical protein
MIIIVKNPRIALSTTANTVYSASQVMITNDTGGSITINQWTGANLKGSFAMPANSMIVLQKAGTDTINTVAGTVSVTPVAARI